MAVTLPSGGWKW